MSFSHNSNKTVPGPGFPSGLDGGCLEEEKKMVAVFCGNGKKPEPDTWLAVNSKVSGAMGGPVPGKCNGGNTLMIDGQLYRFISSRREDNNIISNLSARG